MAPWPYAHPRPEGTVTTERRPTPPERDPGELETQLADIVTRAAAAAGVTLRRVRLGDWAGWWATGHPDVPLEHEALADVARVLVYLPAVHAPRGRKARSAPAEQPDSERALEAAA